jgi:hypothetical protein
MAVAPKKADAVPQGTACTITALVPDVFGAGQWHPCEARTYPDGWFSARQIEALSLDPRLRVSRS